MDLIFGEKIFWTILDQIFYLGPWTIETKLKKIYLFIVIPEWFHTLFYLIGCERYSWILWFDIFCVTATNSLKMVFQKGMIYPYLVNNFEFYDNMGLKYVKSGDFYIKVEYAENSIKEK